VWKLIGDGCKSSFNTTVHFASKVLAQKRFLRDADRALEGTTTLTDPKTMVVKTEAEETVWTRNFEEKAISIELWKFSYMGSWVKRS
jgi:hypothetical protein